MSEIEAGQTRKPGVVIFVAILNFFSCSVFFVMSAFLGLAVIFGAAWGMDQYVSQRMSHYAPNPNFSYGVAWMFGLAAAVTLAMGIFFLCIGLGLLNRKKFAWYLQIAMSMLGLLSLPLGFVTGLFMLPLGTLINIIILVFFFQPRTRDHFGV